MVHERYYQNKVTLNIGPQGYIFRSVLFVVHIISLNDHLRITNLIHYADNGDSKLEKLLTTRGGTNVLI